MILLMISLCNVRLQVDLSDPKLVTARHVIQTHQVNPLMSGRNTQEEAAGVSFKPLEQMM